MKIKFKHAVLNSETLPNITHITLVDSTDSVKNPAMSILEDGYFSIDNGVCKIVAKRKQRDNTLENYGIILSDYVIVDKRTKDRIK